ncbi:hypothetical protein LguiB_027533 [Lonicera macranthoides]
MLSYPNVKAKERLGSTRSAMCNTIVPAGFKFLPRDNKLIKYRICKIHNEPLPYEGIISEEDDVFGDHRPLWELFGGGVGGDHDHGLLVRT